MRFYTRQHKYYCGIDLHARWIFVCIIDQAGEVLVHKNVRAHPQTLLALVAPYREDLVVAVECMFTWYGIADLCAREGFTFILGHALYMKAIHGGKPKKVALVACMRKLLTILNAMIRTNTRWGQRDALTA